MANEPVPSLDLGHDHHLGLHLVGSVGLPSHPAGGRIYVVHYPPPKGAATSAAKLYLKIVQRYSDAHVVTHFVPLEHVRLVRYQAVPATGAEKGLPQVTLTGDELRHQVGKIDWSKSIKDDRCTHEIEFRPNQMGAVFVPETAPVILRTETTLPAATSLESAGISAAFACPHGPRPFACPHGSGNP
jgi:hypothetical protein